VRTEARESIDAAVAARMQEERAKWEAFKAQRREHRQSGGSNPPLPRKDWKKIESTLATELGAGSRDVVNENAMLFLNCGLIYLAFHDACRGGFSGRVEKCVKLFAIMFAGGKHSFQLRQRMYPSCRVFGSYVETAIQTSLARLLPDKPELQAGHILRNR
jgi:hypothetical protein